MRDIALVGLGFALGAVVVGARAEQPARPAPAPFPPGTVTIDRPVIGDHRILRDRGGKRVGEMTRTPTGDWVIRDNSGKPTGTLDGRR